MTPIKQKAWIPANPNREIRRHLEREFIEEKYGYERSTFTPYENGVQILKPIRKFINRFNNGN